MSMRKVSGLILVLIVVVFTIDATAASRQMHSTKQMVEMLKLDTANKALERGSYANAEKMPGPNGTVIHKLLLSYKLGFIA